MSACKRLDLETLGSWPTMSKNVPGHCCLLKEKKRIPSLWECERSSQRSPDARATCLTFTYLPTAYSCQAVRVTRSLSISFYICWWPGCAANLAVRNNAPPALQGINGKYATTIHHAISASPPTPRTQQWTLISTNISPLLSPAISSHTIKNLSLSLTHTRRISQYLSVC